MRFSRRAAVRDFVLAAVALAALAVAAVIFTRSGSGEELAPDDPASAVTFVCEKCGEFFALTPRALEAAMRQGGEASGRSGRTLSLRCTKCSQAAAVRAVRCPQHGEIIRLQPAANQPDKCSKCEFRGP